MPTAIKKSNLAHYIKHRSRYVSQFEQNIAALVAGYATRPDECPIAFTGSAIKLANAAYLEWRRGSNALGTLYPTPFDVAAEMVEMAGVTEADTVFDPGAGLGNLLHAAIQAGARAFGCELQHWICQRLAPSLALAIESGDFLDSYTPSGPFDVILTNPPFGKGHTSTDLTQAFLDRIADLSTEDTRIVALLPRGYVEKTRPKALVETLDRFSIIEFRPVRPDAFKPITSVVGELVSLQLR